MPKRLPELPNDKRIHVSWSKTFFLQLPEISLKFSRKYFSPSRFEKFKRSPNSWMINSCKNHWHLQVRSSSSSRMLLVTSCSLHLSWNSAPSQNLLWLDDFRRGSAKWVRTFKTRQKRVSLWGARGHEQNTWYESWSQHTVTVLMGFPQSPNFSLRVLNSCC